MLEQRPSDHWHLKWLEEENLHTMKDLRVLDLGCGSGFICADACRQGAASSVGIDIIEPKNAQEKSTWRFLQGDLESDDWYQNLRAGGDRFDLIMAFDILEHLSSPFEFLVRCQGLLSPQGRLILTTPNTMSLERMLRPKTWSGATDPQHKVLFNKYSLEFLLERCGLETVNLRAPMRSLSFLGQASPQIGGQLVAVTKKTTEG